VEPEKLIELWEVIVMVKDTRGKNFCCIKCGASFVCHPPDDFHVNASLKPSEIEDPIKVEYRCKECGNTNVLYWGWVKMQVSVG